MASRYPHPRGRVLSIYLAVCRRASRCRKQDGLAPHGRSLKLQLHHKWTYLFVNLGLGDNVTNFNYTLTPSLWNETGNGTLCLPTLPLPVDLNVTDGTRATIQVVTSGESGSALYNCADITFRSSAELLNSSECVTSPGVSVAVVNQQANESTSTNTSSDTNTTTGDAGKSAASVPGVNTVALTSAAGLVVAFVVGLSW